MKEIPLYLPAALEGRPVHTKFEPSRTMQVLKHDGRHCWCKQIGSDEVFSTHRMDDLFHYEEEAPKPAVTLFHKLATRGWPVFWVRMIGFRLRAYQIISIDQDRYVVALTDGRGTQVVTRSDWSRTEIAPTINGPWEKISDLMG